MNARATVLGREWQPRAQEPAVYMGKKKGKKEGKENT
jgi:hypothetical protein